MKPSVFVGLMLILLATLIMFLVTFSEKSVTDQQLKSSLVVVTIAGFSGIGLLRSSMKEKCL